MLKKVLILLFAFAAVLAYSYVEARAYEPVVYQRVRRQLQLQGGGGGSPKQGYDLSIDGRAPVWQSNNGRHQLDLSGGYSQHLGGPWGNSRPDYRVGAGYTFRF